MDTVCTYSITVIDRNCKKGLFKPKSFSNVISFAIRSRHYQQINQIKIAPCQNILSSGCAGTGVCTGEDSFNIVIGAEVLLEEMSQRLTY